MPENYFQNDYYYDLVKRLDTELPPDHIFVEIGTASGTTALRAIDALGSNHSKRWLFTIDPYGDKPYSIGGTDTLKGYDYNDELYRTAMKDIKDRAYTREVNHTHWNMRSQDFMKVFEQIEFWSDGSIQKPKFGLAYLDGEHSWNPVGEEFRWFYHRMPVGSVLSIDDYDLIGGEDRVREELGGLTQDGEWFFNTVDAHHRCYFTKGEVKPA